MRGEEGGREDGYTGTAPGLLVMTELCCTVAVVVATQSYICDKIT